MCGIWCMIGDCEGCNAEECVKQLLPRGPESLKIQKIGDTVTFGFTRLAINGLHESGMQPMTCEDGVHWICNGEIYNWKELRDRHGLVCESESDCSVIGPLWKKLGGKPAEFFKALDGVFSIIIYHEGTGEIIVGRDPYGVRPLFIGFSGRSGVVFSSEMKAMKGVKGIHEIRSFLPGRYARYGVRGGLIESESYHTVPWIKNMLYSPNAEKGLERACEAVRESLVMAVRKRVETSERPIAALLSGGIDSSLIASLVARELARAGKGPLETYSIGFEGSPDLFYARKVAAHIGSKHTEIVKTPDDFFRAIPEVVRAIESYDITSVRASVGNWLVCKEIAERSEAKVIFNGDGSDEVFGSYLYFYRAPSDEEFEAESERLLRDIHMYDVLRSDRSISSHGLEARTPFLDKQFVAVARSVATIWRRPVRGGEGGEGRPEKWVLRKAFEGEDVLPSEVLWRQKEAFSDGVSGHAKSWYEEIQDRVGGEGRGERGEECSVKVYTHLPPLTAESRYYRDLFDSMYGEVCENVIPYFWMPRWSGETTDPSARTLSIYK